MSDLISRRQIHDYIQAQINPYGKPFEGTAYELGLKIMDYIKNMSPVEPVRGEWIKTFRYMRENVNTGNIEPVYSCDCPFCAWHTGNQGVRFNFCPNCGCDMRKKVEE